ncbi:MAG: DUF6163 family protein [Salaquimonas sp.]
MEISLNNKDIKTGLGHLLLVILRRMIALFFVIFALGHWGRIVAFGSFEGSGIVSMPYHWQIASVVLAVTMPVAAIGLWGLFSWGTSTWLAVVALELYMHYYYTDVAFQSLALVWFHIACLLTYIAIKASLKITQHATRVSLSETSGN